MVLLPPHRHANHTSEFGGGKRSACSQFYVTKFPTMLCILLASLVKSHHMHVGVVLQSHAQPPSPSLWGLQNMHT